MEEEGATGFPLPGVTLEIVDADDRPLAPEAHGLVRVRTPAMGAAVPAGAEGRRIPVCAAAGSIRATAAG